MTAGQVRVKRQVQVDGPQLLLQVVIVSVHGVQLLVQHEMSGPKLVVNVLSIDLQLLHLLVETEVLSPRAPIACSNSSCSS